MIFLRSRSLISATLFLILLAGCLVLLRVLPSALMIVFSFFAGTFLFNFDCDWKTVTPSWLFLALPGTERPVSLVPKKDCRICGGRTCKRHNQDLDILFAQPWDGLNIPSNVDEALTEFFECLLQENVYLWHQSLTENEAFVDEIRHCLRSFASSLLVRLKDVDWTTLITDELLKRGTYHLHMYVEIRKKARIVGSDYEQATLNSLPNLHVALSSRQHERQYCRHLVQSLLPHVVPRYNLKCRSICCLLHEIISMKVILPAMDIVADPDTVNLLLQIFLDKSPMMVYGDIKSPRVEILANFAKRKDRSNSTFSRSLEDIIASQSLLYSFMQFLKSHGAVNILQFCLSVDDFNRKILNPDLTGGQADDLHKSACELFNTFFVSTAYEHISFLDDIVEEMRQIVEGKKENVILLRTTTTLFRAYEHACSMLDDIFLPLYLHSKEYYHLICGSQERKCDPKSSSLPRHRNSESNILVAKLSNRLKDLVKSSASDGQRILDECSDVIADTAFNDCEEQDDDLEDEEVRDLNSWRVNISTLEKKFDENDKAFYVFIIEVQRLDVKSEEDLDDYHWTVERRYQEFYVLESKLKEFHGEFDDCNLPKKPTFGTGRGPEFSETNREIFELYLQRLLTKPSLRGSDLLFSFLTSMSEFTSASSLADINFGRMFKSVPMKLMLKDRGRSLETFLQNFAMSTEPPKPKANEEYLDLEKTKPAWKETLHESIYGNNANYLETVRISEERGKDKEDVLRLEGVYDYIVYVAWSLFRIPEWLQTLLIGGRIFVKSTFQTGFHHYLSAKLKLLLVEQRVERLVVMLKDAVFPKAAPPPRTDQQKMQRKQLVLKELKDFLPSFFMNVIDERVKDEGMELIFDILQHQRLNKQLSYVLLDVVVSQLFPELSDP